MEQNSTGAFTGVSSDARPWLGRPFSPQTINIASSTRIRSIIMDDRRLLHSQIHAPIYHLKPSYIFAMLLFALPAHRAFHCSGVRSDHDVSIWSPFPKTMFRSSGNGCKTW
jgi:hypothetical protein